MTVLINRVRRSFYMDSVALMRISATISALAGVGAAALMIGSSTNKRLMRNAALLDDDGGSASANDLIIAIRADDEVTAVKAAHNAEALLDSAGTNAPETSEWEPKSMETALQQLPAANLALISLPGEFAVAEARRAINNGLHVLLFSDNVSIADEIALKKEAQRRELLLMGPDCGSAIIGGVPIAFANVVPSGSVGIVAASGTGLQEVSSLLARSGVGISHAIGVGGRDLKQAVGGITTLMALDALDRSPGTRHIVVISKPPEPAVAKRILERVAKSDKTFTICFLGLGDFELPANAGAVSDLRSAAEHAMSGKRVEWVVHPPDPAALASRIDRGRTKVQGFFSGGTLCAEAQVFFRRAGLPMACNVPIPGVEATGAAVDNHTHVLLDLGDDAYTVGRPHPMIDPSLRNQMIADAVNDRNTGVILLDFVIGYGVTQNPAAELIDRLPSVGARNCVLITSICGTEGDPQRYSQQLQELTDAGIVVAPSNAHAAELAISVVRSVSGGRA